MKEQRRNKGISDNSAGFLLILPGLLVFLAIILFPFINSIIMSFTNKSLLFPDSSFIGTANYKTVFADPNFPQLLTTTLTFVVFATILPFVLGFIWALNLNEKFRGSELLRGLTLINWIIPGTCIGFLWMWIFNGEYGILNTVLKDIGLIDQNIKWMGAKNTAMMTVVVARTWQMLPWYMAFLLGGLQGVPHDQIEAARIDGAGNLRAFWHIILPEMKPIVSLVVLMGTIGNLQHFDLPWVMIEGGPARATTTMSLSVYKTAFKDSFDMGKAATIGTIWAVMLAVVSYIYLRAQRKRDE